MSSEGLRVSVNRVDDVDDEIHLPTPQSARLRRTPMSTMTTGRSSDSATRRFPAHVPREDASQEGEEMDTLLVEEPGGKDAGEVEPKGCCSTGRTYYMLLRTHRSFRNMWLSMFVSGLGSWLNEVATIVVLQRFNTSTFAVAMFFVFRMLSIAVCGPIAGVIIDKRDKSLVLLFCDAIRVFIVLGYLLVQSKELIWLVYVVVFAHSAFGATARPCSQAILPEIVGPKLLPSANAMNAMVDSGTLALGSAIGGLMSAYGGTNLAYVMDSASFLLSVFFVWRLRAGRAEARAMIEKEEAENPQEKPEEAVHKAELDTEKKGKCAEMAAGLTFLFKHDKGTLGIIVLNGFTRFADSTGDMNMTKLSSGPFRLGFEDSSLSFGLTYAAAAAGIFTSALIKGSTMKHPSQRAMFSWLSGAASLLVVSYTLSAWAPWAPLYFFGEFLVGLGLLTVWVQTTNVLQAKSPAHLRGRIFAFASTLRTLMGAAGFLLCSTMFDVLGWSILRVQVVGATIPCGLLTLAFLVYRARSRAS